MHDLLMNSCYRDAKCMAISSSIAGREILGDYHADLVKYENKTSLSRRNIKYFDFTSSCKANLVECMKTSTFLSR